MAQTQDSKARAKAAREARKAELAELKRAEAEQIDEARERQLAAVKGHIERLTEKLTELEETHAQCEALFSHVSGFYDEIEKLAKGKTLLTVTDMVVIQVNEIIGDAKKIIDDDLYLERMNLFVPAGDNPVYPDVLIVTRNVIQAARRFKESYQGRRKTIQSSINVSRVVTRALQLRMEEPKYAVTYADLKISNSTKMPASFFVKDEDNDLVFDFNRVDSTNLIELLGCKDDSTDAFTKMLEDVRLG